MEEGILSSLLNPTHFYIDAQNDDEAEDVDLSQKDSPTITNNSTFLRMLQQVITKLKQDLSLW